MIRLHFDFGGDRIMVEIKGKSLMFGNISKDNFMVPVDKLKLDHKGIIKEFPDLKNDSKWKDKAVKRFKSHVSNLKSEDERAEYVIDDLKHHGYKAKLKEKSGFRAKVL